MGKQTFTTTGSQTWTNPGVTSVTAKIWAGGGGGAGGGSSGVGGDGGPSGFTQGTHTILSTDDLTVFIGGGGGLGTGGSTSGDGAGGGGASYIQIVSGSVLQVTSGAGGGGGGDNSATTAGGDGGASGPATAEAGGSSGTATGGGGGTASAGGAGGTGADNGGAGTDTAGGEGGSNNATVGGSGGTGGGGDGGGQDTSGFAGGGGGGGSAVRASNPPYSGGGGGSSVSGNAGGGGGGAGANYIDSGATSTTNTAGGAGPGDVANDTDGDYVNPKGEGGTGGATTSNGVAGQPGLVVLSWPGPVINDVSLGKNTTDDPLRPNTTGATVTGADFGATQGSGNLWLTNNATWGSETVKIAQDVTSWADTSLTFNVTFGPHIQGDQLWLWVEDDGDLLSNACKVLISFPDFHVQESGAITCPSGTGLQTIWTPDKDGFGGPTAVHPVRAFFIESIGNTANDTAQTEVGKYMGVVIDSDGGQLQLGWASAGTDGSLDDTRYQGDANGFALYDDAASTTPATLGTLSISSGGALQCNFSTNANLGEKLRIVAFAGRTLRARIKTDGVTGSPMTGIDVPSDPSLAIFGGVGQQWSDAGEAFGKFQVGFWDGKASANAWWAAAHWSLTSALNAIVQSAAGFGQYNGTNNSYELTALAYGADGDNRQLTWTGGSSSDEWGGLFLWTDGFDCDTGVVSKETTGVDDVTQNIVSGLAYDPAFAFLLTASRTNEDPTLDAGTSARWATGRAVRSDLTTQGAITSTIILNVSVYDCDSIVTQAADRIMMAHDDVTAAVDFAGEATDMKGGKLEVTWRTADTRAAVIGYMVLETSTAGVPTDFIGPAL